MALFFGGLALGSLGIACLWGYWASMPSTAAVKLQRMTAERDKYCDALLRIDSIMAEAIYE